MKALMTLLRTAMLAAALALGTVAFAWWAVPAISLLWGLMASRQRGAALTAGIAAMLAWGVLLARDATQGPIGPLSITLGQVFGMNAAVLIVVTLALPGLLALTATIVGRAVRR